MRLRSVLVFTSIIIASFYSSLAPATLIESRGYKLDTTTNIISDGELEWLNWDETIEMSLQNVYDDARFDGWRIATNDEMYGLLDNFFGPNLDVDMNSTRRERVNSTFGTQFGEEFFTLFTGFLDNFCGYPGVGPTCIANPQNRAKVLFGSPDNLKSLFIRDEYVWQVNTRNPPVNVWGYLEVNSGPNTISTNVWETGIALVRGVDKLSNESTNTIDVPSPPIFSLTAVLGVALFIRKKASQMAR